MSPLARRYFAVALGAGGCGELLVGAVPLSSAALGRQKLDFFIAGGGV